MTQNRDFTALPPPQEKQERVLEKFVAPVAVVVVVAVADSVPAAVVAGPPVGPAAEVAAEVADGDDVSSCWQPATAGATATVSAVIAKANARGACFGMYALPPSAQ